MLCVGIVGSGPEAVDRAESITRHFSNLTAAGICAPDGDLHALFTDPQVNAVLDLSRPMAGDEVTRQALCAGKHVYRAHPLLRSGKEAAELRELAKAKGLLLGGGPDAFLGAAQQTARRLMEDGFIGTPVGAAVRCVRRGGEDVLCDAAPCALSALIQLLGRVSAVSAMGTNEHLTALARFGSGITAEMLFSARISPERESGLEIFGSEGALRLQSPCAMGGEVRLFRRGDREACPVPLMFPHGEETPGLGLSEMAAALEEGRPHRAGADQLVHISEVLSALRRSAETGREVRIRSPFRRMSPMPSLAEPEEE